jgi:hypothetical protein
MIEFIENPLLNEGGWLNCMIDTHQPIDHKIKALRADVNLTKSLYKPISTLASCF